MNYYIRFDLDDNPLVLYRGTPAMEEEVWSPGEGWIPGEFLLDVLEGHNNTYYVTEEFAKKWFPDAAYDWPFSCAIRVNSL